VLHASRALRDSAQNVAAAEALDPASPFPTGVFLAPPQAPESDMFGVAYVADFGGSDFRAIPQQHARVMTDRTAAAQALAVRLFRLDHGRAPAPAELVPEYLPYTPPYQRLVPPARGLLSATAPATGPVTQPAGAPD
jgi:hypothetical protein